MAAAQDCLFCKIASNELPATVRYQDDRVVAFDDIHPKAPVHQLIIPRTHVATLNDWEAVHNDLMGHMVQVARRLAAQSSIDQSGYRLVINCNRDAGQVIFHVHMHLMGGAPLPL